MRERTKGVDAYYELVDLVESHGGSLSGEMRDKMIELALTVANSEVPRLQEAVGSLNRKVATLTAQRDEALAQLVALKEERWAVVATRNVAIKRAEKAEADHEELCAKFDSLTKGSGSLQARADSLERPCANCDCTLVRCYDARSGSAKVIACCPECDHRARKEEDGH